MRKKMPDLLNRIDCRIVEPAGGLAVVRRLGRASCGFVPVCIWIHPQIIPTNGHFSWESGLPARCLWMSVSTTDNDAARAVVFLGQKVQPYRLNNP